MKELVSIIMPTYNCAGFIKEAVESVLAQDYPYWELIITDDGSTDNTKKILTPFLTKYKNIFYFRSDKNNGPAISRSMALKHAKGSFIAFLDSDDLWLPNKLSKQISFMKSNNVAFSATGYEIISETGNSQGVAFIPPKITDYNTMLRLSCPIGNSTVIYNKHILGEQEIPNIKKRNDFALWLKLLHNNNLCYGMPEILTKYRLRKQSISSNKLKLLPYHWHLYYNIENLGVIKSIWYILCWAWVKGTKIGLKKVSVNKNDKSRILQIIPRACQDSGILQVVLNWHRNIDKTKIQFDYLFFNQAEKNVLDEIKSLGGVAYKLPHPCKQPLQFLKNTFSFFKQHRYDSVHSHITHLNLLFFPLLKLFGTKNIIQHAHSIKWGSNKLSAIRNYLLLHTVWPLIKYKLACSKVAGKVYFGKNFRVIYNGIDVEKFKYNSKIRSLKRDELGLKNNFIIGHIGRFSQEKNHNFLIDIFKNIVEKDSSARLILIGSGPLERDVRMYVKKNLLEGKVIFLGIREDVAELYQAFDCFVFPSLHEGFGLAAIEAQTSGLPCVLADTLPSEAFICNCKKLSLKNKQKWVKEILKFSRDYKRKNTEQEIVKAGFSAKEASKQIQKFYMEISV